MAVVLAVALLVSVAACSPNPASVTVAPSKAELLDAGGTVQLTPTVLDQKGKAIPKMVVSYASQNPAIAEVDDMGKVTGLKRGTTQVKIRAGINLNSMSISVR